MESRAGRRQEAGGRRQRAFGSPRLIAWEQMRELDDRRLCVRVSAHVRREEEGEEEGDRSEVLI